MLNDDRPADTGEPFRICILFDTIELPWGGGNQFLKGLASELAAMGHKVSKRPEPDTQIVLLNAHNMGANKRLHSRQVAQLRQTGKMNWLGSFLPEWFQLRGSRKGPVLVHRVDGVAELVRGHRTDADEIQPAVNRLTDHTIFQSEYCRDSFSEHCGMSPTSSRVITNGTNPSMFFPDPEVAWDGGPLRLVAASWSSNPRKGFADLARFSLLHGVELTFAGNWCPDVDPEDVRLAGVLNSTDLGGLMRANHALMQPARNEPCSNVLVEAMACGLPVIYRDSGGNQELAGDYGVAMSGDAESTLDTLRGGYLELRHRVLADRDRFLIRRAADEYLSLFRFAIATQSAVRLV